jgi:tetratricopeptide (TPR) repeat protein
MIKKYLILFFVIFFFSIPVYSASTGSSSSEKAKSNGREDLSHLSVKNSYFKKGYDALKQAKKYKKKGKEVRAEKRFNDAIQFFLQANVEAPNEPDILNYLGFSYRKVDDFAMAEIYYTQGLEIDPTHNEINKYLGQLYIETNKIDEAKKRLDVLKSCACKEYNELKKSIKLSSSKY